MKTNDLWLEQTDRDEQILEAAERILRRKMERQGKLIDPTSAASFLRAHCAYRDREIFGCIFLDTRHAILAIEDLFFGTIDAAEVHPREIVKRALLLNAAAVVVFHNHPSGNPEPSVADRAITARIKQALELVEVRLLDHIVVGADGMASLALRGWV
ncbi:MAG: DNA repair protein RadC [Sphingomonadales bacterium]|nr:DNA repair protein RadC [Sphingomonadales bacterium]